MGSFYQLITIILFYSRRGQFRFAYNGENKKANIINFMRDPNMHQMQQKQKEVVDESWSQDSDVLHLTST